MSLLIKGIPEVESLRVAGSEAELEGADANDPVLVIYQNDAGTLSRVIPLLRDPQALLLVCDQDQNPGMNLRDAAPAWGLVSTAISPEAFRTAILAVAQQLTVVESRFIEKNEAIFSLSVHSDEPHEALTERELTVLRKIAEGLTNKMIAQELGISENTVKFHISALFSKINASSRTDAIRRGARLGLLAL